MNEHINIFCSRGQGHSLNPNHKFDILTASNHNIFSNVGDYIYGLFTKVNDSEPRCLVFIFLYIYMYSYIYIYIYSSILMGVLRYKI